MSTTRIYTEIVKYLPVLKSGWSLQKHLVQTWMRGEEEEERKERRMEGRRMEKGEGWKRKRREEREVCPIPTICRNTKQNCNG